MKVTEYMTVYTIQFSGGELMTLIDALCEAYNQAQENSITAPMEQRKRLVSQTNDYDRMIDKIDGILGNLVADDVIK